MSARPGVAEFTRVGELLPKQAFDVPEPERQALASDIQAQLGSLPTVIGDDETYRKAKESLPLLKRAEDRVVGFFRDIKDAANKAHKAITTKEAEQLKPIKDARQRISSLIYGYEQEQTRVRRAAELEAARIEQERQQAAALEEAAAISDLSPEMAEQIVEQAIAAPAPVIVLPSQAVDVAGVSITANWQFKYEGCAAGVEFDKLPDEDRQRVMRLLPREYLRPDEKALGKVVKALKGGTRIPGIQAYDAGTVRVRG